MLDQGAPDDAGCADDEQVAAILCGTRGGR
jgi:hypothetical protein